MANFERFAGKLIALEGGYVNHPKDRGGATKYGVILSIWKEHGHDKDNDGDIDADDIKLLTYQDAKRIAKTLFWDYFRADEIKNQSLAEFIVDWGYNSGRKLAARKLQRILNVADDGIVGIQTLNAINQADSKTLFYELLAERIDFIEDIIKRRPDQIVFYKGWLNRINKFYYNS
jgi:lysozyme family protein